MSNINRSFSAIASDAARTGLERLLTLVNDPEDYASEIYELGALLGHELNKRIPGNRSCLLAATAEDADFLGRGIYDSVKKKHETKAAVFWNNHYQIAGGGSIAPVVHKFLEPGHKNCEVLIIAKSIISGSCVVRTNLLEVIESITPQKIFIVAPVMHAKSEASLRKEFPRSISDKFKFVVFATDSERTETGEVLPGIGGTIYPLLGLTDQPALSGFMPRLVQELAFS